MFIRIFGVQRTFYHLPLRCREEIKLQIKTLPAREDGGEKKTHEFTWTEFLFQIHFGKKWNKVSRVNTKRFQWNHTESKTLHFWAVGLRRQNSRSHVLLMWFYSCTSFEMHYKYTGAHLMQPLTGKWCSWLHVWGGGLSFWKIKEVRCSFACSFSAKKVTWATFYPPLDCASWICKEKLFHASTSAFYKMWLLLGRRRKQNRLVLSALLAFGVALKKIEPSSLAVGASLSFLARKNLSHRNTRQVL